MMCNSEFVIYNTLCRNGMKTRRRVPLKPLKTCLLPGCDKTTRHNGGYCCAAHNWVAKDMRRHES